GLPIFRNGAGTFTEMFGALQGIFPSLSRRRAKSRFQATTPTGAVRHQGVGRLFGVESGTGIPVRFPPHQHGSNSQEQESSRRQGGGTRSTGREAETGRSDPRRRLLGIGLGT